MKLNTSLAAALLCSTGFAGMAAAQTNLDLWYHGGGNTVEREIIDKIIADFNGSQAD